MLAFVCYAHKFKFTGKKCLTDKTLGKLLLENDDKQSDYNNILKNYILSLTIVLALALTNINKEKKSLKFRSKR